MSEELQDCPNCPNQGWYAVLNWNTGEPEQEQCEWCWTTPNSKFLAEERKAALDAVKDES